jgi:hypothetical protein
MRIPLLLIVLVAAVIAAATASPATAASEQLFRYWGQDLMFYGDYHTSRFDSKCNPMSGSAAEFHGYGWMTVALIDTGGTWRRVSRSNGGILEVDVDPHTFSEATSWRKLALCKNSGSTSVSASCYYWYYLPDSPCV